MDLVEIKEGNAYRHPWELARAKSVLKIISDLRFEGTVADVGAGDIYFAGLLADQLNKDVLAVDIGYEEIGKVGRVTKMRHISELPDEALGLVLLMDVIEHIDDVDAFLNELMPKVKPGGVVLITVPAYQFLFSAHDVFLRHYRRYNRNLLTSTLAKQSVAVERMFYFFTSLFFARTAALAMEKLKGKADADGIGNWKYPETHGITRFITSTLTFDFKLNNLFAKTGLTFPGLTLCTICRKKH